MGSETVSGTITTTSAHEVKPSTAISHLAGNSALKHLLLDSNSLEREYFEHLTHVEPFSY
jgi:hypothetical protein